MAQTDSSRLRQQLRPLLRRLGTLRNRRWLVRQGAAWAALFTWILWVLAGLLMIDWIGQFPVSQRIVLYAVGLLVLLRVLWKVVLPQLRRRETIQEMALWVERHHRINNDLIASLQFAEAHGRTGGSPQLTARVVQDAASRMANLDWSAGFPWGPFSHRMRSLAATVAVVGLATALFPGHARAFVDRLLLGKLHYPAAPEIRVVAVNQQLVLERLPLTPAQPQNAAISRGGPLQFVVKCDGPPPRLREVRLSALAGDLRNRRVPLEPLSLEQRRRSLVEARQQIGAALADAEALDRLPRQELATKLRFDAPAAAEALARAASETGDLRHGLAEVHQQLQKRLDAWPGAAEQTSLLQGQLPHLVEPAHFQVCVGSGWTDAAQIELIPRPAVELQVTVVPPAYARTETPEPQTDARRFTALEGSNIQFRARATNERPLKTVRLHLKADGGEPAVYPLQPIDPERRTWSLDVRKTPLAALKKNIEFELQAHDRDGYSLERPLRGTIRIQPDRPPSGTVECRHARVTPRAFPTLNCTAIDDYGIAEMAVEVQIQRRARDAASRFKSPPAGVSASAPPAVETPSGKAGAADKNADQDRGASGTAGVETRRLSILPTGERLSRDQLPYRTDYTLQLAPWKLEKGDRLKITLVTKDYRGEAKAATVRSSPLYLEVSDSDGANTPPQTILNADRAIGETIDKEIQSLEAQLELLKEK